MHLLAQQTIRHISHLIRATARLSHCFSTQGRTNTWSSMEQYLARWKSPPEADVQHNDVIDSARLLRILERLDVCCHLCRYRLRTTFYDWAARPGCVLTSSYDVWHVFVILWDFEPIPTYLWLLYLKYAFLFVMLLIFLKTWIIAVISISLIYLPAVINHRAL